MPQIIQTTATQVAVDRRLVPASTKVVVSQRDYVKLAASAIADEITDLGPGILFTAPYTLTGATEANQVLATITPGFAGRVVNSFAVVTTAVSTASRSAAIQPWVDSVPGVNEVDSLITTGTPTGGTFTITVNGVTSAPIAFNAAAATVQAALVAMSNIAAGDVVCGGGALPTAVTLTWGGAFAGQAVSVSASGAGLTGGTTPTAVVTNVTAGTVGSDGFAPRATAGGLLSLTSANATPASKIVPGTQITAKNEFGPNGTISFRTVAAPTAFAEGAVLFGVTVAPLRKTGPADI